MILKGLKLLMLIGDWGKRDLRNYRTEIISKVRIGGNLHSSPMYKARDQPDRSPAERQLIFSQVDSTVKDEDTVIKEFRSFTSGMWR